MTECCLNCKYYLNKLKNKEEHIEDLGEEDEKRENLLYSLEQEVKQLKEFIDSLNERKSEIEQISHYQQNIQSTSPHLIPQKINNNNYYSPIPKVFPKNNEGIFNWSDKYNYYMKKEENNLFKEEKNIKIENEEEEEEKDFGYLNKELSKYKEDFDKNEENLSFENLKENKQIISEWMEIFGDENLFKEEEKGGEENRNKIILKEEEEENDFELIENQQEEFINQEISNNNWTKKFKRFFKVMFILFIIFCFFLPNVLSLCGFDIIDNENGQFFPALYFPIIDVELSEF
uniref:Transmembrane protein n=1 Tax=Meloidogyne floridensis TaxID=298350 RepID=A0A915NXG0_9BILA